MEDLPFSQTSYSAFPESEGLYTKVEGVVMPREALLTFSTIVSYQYSQKSDFLSIPLLLVQSSSYLQVFFFAVYLHFCPLLHFCLQHDISFDILVSVRLCKPSEVLGAAISPRTFGFDPPHLLE